MGVNLCTGTQAGPQATVHVIVTETGVGPVTVTGTGAHALAATGTG